MSKASAKGDTRNVVLTDVLRTLRAELPKLEKAYNIRSLGVFGSIVRGDQRPRSDVDILADFTCPPTFFELVELEDRLTDLLGVRADVVMRSALKPRIGDRILSEVVDV